VDYIFRVSHIISQQKCYLYLALVVPLTTVLTEGNAIYCGHQLGTNSLILVESIINQHIIIKTDQYYKFISVLK
jgi:hypothetical protein